MELTCFVDVVKHVMQPYSDQMYKFFFSSTNQRIPAKLFRGLSTAFKL